MGFNTYSKIELGDVDPACRSVIETVRDRLSENQIEPVSVDIRRNWRGPILATFPGLARDTNTHLDLKDLGTPFLHVEQFLRSDILDCSIDRIWRFAQLGDDGHWHLVGVGFHHNEQNGDEAPYDASLTLTIDDLGEKHTGQKIGGVLLLDCPRPVQRLLVHDISQLGESLEKCALAGVARMVKEHKRLAFAQYEFSCFLPEDQAKHLMRVTGVGR